MTNLFKSLFCLVLMINASSTEGSVNGLYGNIYQKYYALTGKPSTSLLPVYEQQVRAVADELGMFVGDVKHCHQSLAPYVPFTQGNTLFLSNEWFVQWKNDPLAQKFAIARELAHVENARDIKYVALLTSMTVISSYLLYQACHYTGIADKVDAYVTKSFPTWITPYMPLLGKLMLLGTGHDVSQCALLKLCRSQEFAADKRSLEKLTPLYGSEAVIEAAASYLSKTPGFEPMVGGFFSPCPHSRDRLRALGLPKTISQEAGAQIHKLCNDRVQLTYEYGIGDEKEKAAIGVRLMANWLELSQKVRICSAHEDVAQHYIATINEHKTSYAALFAQKFNDFINDPGNKDYCRRHPALANPQQAAEIAKKYSDAIMQRCEMLIAALEKKL